ncbi:MAG: single-stranded-DNA-specific exonuclease RecJ [Acidobacteria bacterium]|nr:MAG: single-stranded-DNA-specific exonuclease RecJ [Acidobacteriota bacterium]REK01386.1 MAG: single-stranded-DNA-specific exonuclease RecJ [Acidobacteriota bacterium]REK14342.1 MAG: single-stranded-DNA-specific exonuclease RecJ [Acidobacteriota bacterium]REK45057.1 MAG: single-stranded-DNA-specific exonuclease RecJ [Acidobacteriota bacterium]
MKRWNFIEHDMERVEAFSKETGLSRLIAALLIARGYGDPDSAQKFLNPSYEDLHDPYLLKDMDRAVKRIFRAVEDREKILVWGDYDVDGTTGTVVLRKALEMIGAESGYHVPHRFTEGYGLNIPALENARNEGYKLVITVDCGSTSFEPISWAKENDVDVIVTDHHLTKDEGLPEAFAVVNPNRPDCGYPDKHLAGVGVAFKLAHALLRERGRESAVPHFLKVVAIGTIADVMMLTGENRAIVTAGLNEISSTVNYGLKALIEVADCRDEMTALDIGFRVAPRINAAGRMDAARHVVELFESEDFGEARKLAEYLNRKNIERQKLQKTITEKALHSALENGGADSRFIVVYGEGWHRGVIGLAASKVAEKLHRPSIVISVEDGMGHGSARSVSGYHLLKGLDTCSDLFETYGGHAAAAGMQIRPENIEELSDRLNRHAAQEISQDDLIPEIRIDAPVSSATLGLELTKELKNLEPFGQGNPKPVFATGGLTLVDEPWVMKEKHLKLKLRDDDGRPFEAVWWDGVERSAELELRSGQEYELAYTPEENTWRGVTRLQLNIKDIKHK